MVLLAEIYRRNTASCVLLAAGFALLVAGFVVQPGSGDASSRSDVPGGATTTTRPGDPTTTTNASRAAAAAVGAASTGGTKSGGSGSGGSSGGTLSGGASSNAVAPPGSSGSPTATTPVSQLHPLATMVGLPLVATAGLVALRSRRSTRRRSSALSSSPEDPAEYT